MQIRTQTGVYTAKYQYPTEKTSLESLVKPGDAKTANQIANEAKLGFNPQEVYTEETLYDFIRMDRIDKLQFIREREAELNAKRRDYLQEKEEIFQQQLQKKRDAEIQEAIKKQQQSQQQPIQ